VLRLKHPSERRPTLQRENPLVFWPRFVWETFAKHALLAGIATRLLVMKMAVGRVAKMSTYMDQALTPVEDDEEERLDLFTKTAGARAAVAHTKKISELTRVGSVAQTQAPHNVQHALAPAQRPSS
jgi:hypothetical protein